jgi:hypothetical protein
MHYQEYLDWKNYRSFYCDGCKHSYIISGNSPKATVAGTKEQRCKRQGKRLIAYPATLTGIILEDKIEDIPEGSRCIEWIKTYKNSKKA